MHDSAIRISCSIGIEVYVFDESLETPKILNDADSAMYKSKVRRVAIFFIITNYLT